jgi:predicted nucleic acid-binding protein
VRSCLIDSGPLIALFAVDDRHHTRFDTLVKEESVRGLRLLTTFEMLKWIELGGAVVYPFEPAHLGDMVRWMRRYSEAGKREMDLADASLYWLAVESGVTDIMTVDVTDFSRFRLPRGKAFTLL